MTVLVCIPCLMTGGTEIQTLSLVRALIAAGYRVVTACYFEHTSQIVERYKKAGAIVELMSSDGSRSNGTRTTFKHLWIGFRRIIKQYHPNIAHVQYMAPGTLPIIVLRLLGIKKIVTTFHTSGDIYSNTGLKLIRILNSTLIKASQCITLNAEKSLFGKSQIFSEKENLKKTGNHFTIYNNLPTHIAIRTIARTEKNKDQSIVVGVVSRLEAVKGMDLVIPAFAEALKANNQLRFLIAGNGSQLELMQQQAIELNLSDKVNFLGLQPQEKLQECYDRIDILVVPSRSEGFGLTALEGMARGCIIVASDVGGLSEIVNHRFGFLFPKESISGLVNAIVDASASNLNQYSSEAILAASSYSSERYNTHIKNLYNLI